MELLMDENRPEVCASLGLDCRSCIEKAALSVARVCAGMDSRNVNSIFLQLYPSSGCSPMASAFEVTYLGLSQPAATSRLAVVAA